MATFRYKAVDESGAQVGGTLVAESRSEALAQLREMRLFPERVDSAISGTGRLLDVLPGKRLKSGVHVALFTRECAVLLVSGVQLVDALEVLARQSEFPPLATALLEVRDAVNSGSSFADALARYPVFFDRSYVGMVASGEKSGTMDVVFTRLADFLERRRLMQAKVSTALIYPAILVVMVVGLLVFLSGIVVPQIAPLIAQQSHGRTLPLATRLLFFLGAFVSNYGWIVFLAAAVGLGVLGWVARRPAGRRKLDAWALHVPLFGSMIRKSLVSRFTMTFATLLRTGVPALDALEALGKLTPNTVFAVEINRIREDVVEGKDISGRMRGGTLFPPMVGYMVAVGEKSGNLAEVLEHVSRVYDVEVEISSQRILAVLEPVLVLCMAGVVGFIAMSLMVTILELSHF